ncbi:SGNH/GDSL hydrolase family protein [Luedemannella helvata]|uniref:SGNH/GDSL hydrolase family protein n=1 Tax=Luedemannella helvata TaxID=349315 RepID=A0ABP4X8D1_9ACTN
MVGHWVATWAAMPMLTEPADLPPHPYVADGVAFADATLRQTFRVSLGGGRIRLRLTNAFGDCPLPIAAVTVALPAGGAVGVGAIEPETARTVTFHGRPSVVVAAGAPVLSDPLDIDLAPRSALAVTAYLAQGQPAGAVTSHPGSRTTSHVLAGNRVADADLAGAARVDHWYFLGGVEVWAPAATEVVALLGDSLTDGRGSTTNGNDRWPDQLLDRLPGGVAMINQAGGGNRVLNDGLGPSALARLDRDILAQSGVRRLVVFEGVNDIGTAAATEAAQKQVVADLVAAYEQIVERARARGIRVYGATITPFGGGGGYDDPGGHREGARQAVNRWIREGGTFEAVFDFDAAVRDPADPRRLLPAYDEGDHLHINPAGYGAIAAAVPAGAFA